MACSMLSMVSPFFTISSIRLFPASTPKAIYLNPTWHILASISRSTLSARIPLEQRKNRVRLRDVLTNREIDDRIKAQMELEKKLEEADYVVSNGKSLIDLDKEVQSLYRWLKVRLQEDKTKDK